MIFLLRNLGRKGQLQTHISSIIFKGISPGNEVVERDCLGRFFIRHLRIEKGTGAEMGPAIVSGIVTEDAPAAIGQFHVTIPEAIAKVKSAKLSCRF